jgi:hypothetical protein
MDHITFILFGHKYPKVVVGKQPALVSFEEYALNASPVESPDGIPAFCRRHQYS